MNTKIININEKSIDMKKIREAAILLNDGGLVAFPTETVYGLGADALNPEAVSRIFEAKGRPGDNPLIVHIYSLEQLGELVEEIPKEAMLLAKKFWPGPLTMILQAKKIIPQKVTGGLNTIAVRMPKNIVALSLLKESGKPIAAPSANLSGRPSPTKGTHVVEDLMGKVEAIIIAENAEIGIESTVLDLTTKPAVILRPGSITKDDLQKYIEVIEESPGSDGIPKSPGTKYKHYAPRSDLLVVTGNSNEKLKKFEKIIFENSGKKIGIMTTKELAAKIFAENLEDFVFKTMGSLDSPKEITANLYALLREFDTEDVEIIYIEEIPEEISGKAYKNRVEKASGGKYL